MGKRPWAIKNTAKGMNEELRKRGGGGWATKKQNTSWGGKM